MENSKVNDEGFIEIINNRMLVVFKGTLIGIIAIAVTSILPALLIKYSVFSTSKINIFSILTLFIGNMIGAYFSAIMYGKNGMFIGVITSLSILVIAFLFGLLFQTVSFEMIDFSLFLVKLFGLMLFGAIGGIIGINIIS